MLVCPKGVLFHISAGNMDALPAYSVLEGLLTGNINLLKLPSEDHGLSRFLLEKLMEYQPVLRDYIYIFDLPSQDLEGMRKLMDLANAIILWGSDEAVSQVRRYAPVNTEIIEWGAQTQLCLYSKAEYSGRTPAGPCTPYTVHQSASVQFLSGNLFRHRG